MKLSRLLHSIYRVPCQMIDMYRHRNVFFVTFPKMKLICDATDESISCRSLFLIKITGSIVPSEFIDSLMCLLGTLPRNLIDILPMTKATPTASVLWKQCVLVILVAFTAKFGNFALQKRNDILKATKLFRECLSIKEKSLSPTHPDLMKNR